MFADVLPFELVEVLFSTRPVDAVLQRLDCVRNLFLGRFCVVQNRLRGAQGGLHRCHALRRVLIGVDRFRFPDQCFQRIFIRDQAQGGDRRCQIFCCGIHRILRCVFICQDSFCLFQRGLECGPCLVLDVLIRIATMLSPLVTSASSSVTSAR